MFGLSNRPGVGNVIKIKPPIIIMEDEASKAIDTLSSVERFVNVLN